MWVPLFFLFVFPFEAPPPLLFLDDRTLSTGVICRVHPIKASNKLRTVQGSSPHLYYWTRLDYVHWGLFTDCLRVLSWS